MDRDSACKKLNIHFFLNQISFGERLLYFPVNGLLARNLDSADHISSTRIWRSAFLEIGKVITTILGAICEFKNP